MNRSFAFLVFAIIALKVCASFFTNFSLYGDEAQYWLWSQNLDLGYFSKPPLLAWFLSGHIILFGDSFFSLKMFPLLVYFLIFFAVYRLCLQLCMSKSSSVICSFSFILIPAASVSSFLISTDLLLLLFWVLAMIKLLEIRNVASVLNFFLLGIFLGLAFLAKYAAVYFLLSFLILIFTDKKILISLKGSVFGWFVFVLVLILILLPNIYWNNNNGWVTLSHTSDNANLKNLNFNFGEPLRFLFLQIFMVGPVLFLSFLYMFKYFRLDFENKFLLVFSLPIIMVVLVEGFLVRANANWAAPALLALLILFYRSIKKHKTIIININFFFNLGLGLFLFFAIATSMPLKVFDRISGLKDFALEVGSITDGKTLVVNDRMLFSSLSYELRDRSIKILMPYNPSGPVKNHFQLKSKLEVGQNKKFYLVGSPENISYLSQKHQTKIIKTINKKFISEQIIIYEVSF